MTASYNLAEMRPNGKGRVREVGRKTEAQHVEDTACISDAPGSVTVLHELVNSPKAVTTCIHCGRVWADLDAELNDGLKTRERT